MSQPPKQLKNYNWLYNQYVTLNKSASQIGRELGCQQETVSNWLHRHQIELRPHGQDVSGEKSGLYHKPVSEERRKHIREGVLASYASGNNSRWTEEKRADWSKQMSGSGNYNYGRVTPEEQKERQKATLKKTLSENPEIQKQMSICRVKYYETHPFPASIGDWKGSHYKCKNGDKIWVRSSYETRYIKALEDLDIEYEYEKSKFKLSNLSTIYTPDFYLKNFDLFIEVKGWMRDKSKNKLIEFHKEYPEIKLIIVYKEQLAELEYDMIYKCVQPIERYGITIQEQVNIWNNESN